MELGTCNLELYPTPVRPAFVKCQDTTLPAPLPAPDPARPRPPARPPARP